MDETKLYPFLFSMAEEDHSSIVICNMEHEIIYMNPAAKEHYAKWGGAQLIGQNLLWCHNADSRQKIEEVLAWFRESRDHNRIYTFYNEKEKKDVYMIALRDAEGELIGYYEKHEYRSRETMEMYQMERLI